MRQEVRCPKCNSWISHLFHTTAMITSDEVFADKDDSGSVRIGWENEGIGAEDDTHAYYCPKCFRELDIGEEDVPAFFSPDTEDEQAALDSLNAHVERKVKQRIEDKDLSA